MKKLFLVLLWPLIIKAQEVPTLSLDKAYELAQQNYPVIKQRELLRQTMDITLDNLSKGFLPQFSLNGQATYQSDVTQIKIPVQGFSMNPLSKDQYKILADINQLVYDGGITKEQKNIQRLNENAEQQKVGVELYKLKERINQVYLGVLYLDEQVKQVELVKADLNNGIKKTSAQLQNGVAFRSSLNVLKAELLKAEQRVIEIKASRKGLIDVLSLFINKALPENVSLQKPLLETTVLSNTIERPELRMFSTQESLLNGQYKMIASRNKPKASLFAQGGYGRPGLNFLNNDFDFFYTAGLRFNWTFGGLYTKKNDKQLIEVNKKFIAIQKETFLLNTNTSLKQQESEVNKLQQLIAKDKEIIDLRLSVKEAANAQLENGVVTANDYLREVNAEDQARQSLITHQLQLLQAQINYQTISGKQ
jgi:outer membrane protein TolC